MGEKVDLGHRDTRSRNPGSGDVLVFVADLKLFAFNINSSDIEAVKLNSEVNCAALIDFVVELEMGQGIEGSVPS